MRCSPRRPRVVIRGNPPRLLVHRDAQLTYFIIYRRLERACQRILILSGTPLPTPTSHLPLGSEASSLSSPATSRRPRPWPAPHAWIGHVYDFTNRSVLAETKQGNMMLNTVTPRPLGLLSQVRSPQSSLLPCMALVCYGPRPFADASWERWFPFPSRPAGFVACCSAGRPLMGLWCVNPSLAAVLVCT